MYLVKRIFNGYNESMNTTTFYGDHPALDLMNTVMLVDGSAADTWQSDGDVLHWLREAYKHGKPIAASGAGVDLLMRAALGKAVVAMSSDPALVSREGVVTSRLAPLPSEFTERFAAAISGTLPAEDQARRLSQSLAVLVQGSLLIAAAAREASIGTRAVAESFCSTRLNPEAGWGAVFGAADVSVDADPLLERAFQG